MSTKAMAQAWDAALKPIEKLVLLAYADNTPDDGLIQPVCTSLIAKMTGISSEALLQKISKDLVRKGWLVPYRETIDGATRYRMVVGTDSNKDGEASPFQDNAEEVAAPKKEFVYLVHDGTGAFKIGRTNDLKRRIWDQMQPAYPRKLELIYSIITDKAKELEAYWHERFRDKRMNGEWFALTEEDIRLFKGIV